MAMRLRAGYQWEPAGHADSAPGPGPGANPLQCGVCGKVLSNRTSLNVHVRTHTGERPYRCTLCSATFNDMSNMRRHRVVHTKAKRYQCDVCHARFSQSGNLRMHIRKSHPEVAYS